MLSFDPLDVVEKSTFATKTWNCHHTSVASPVDLYHGQGKEQVIMSLDSNQS